MVPPNDRHRRSPSSIVNSDAELFRWRGAGIVLFGESSGDRWIVTRGWLGQDTLTDVRHWTFDSPRTFGGQVRRLTFDATGNRQDAAAAGLAAADWAASFT